MKRICIYPKDVQIITGKGEKYARVLLSKIRKKHGKDKAQLISIREFCEYTGLEKEAVEKMIY